jgi:HK97 gp10 family phage protein
MFKIVPTSETERTLLIISNMPIKTKSGMRQGLFKFGTLLKKTLQADILKKPKGGREYFIRRGGRRFRHIAAADGETPANITGRLRKSVDFKVSGSNRMEFGYDNSVDYGLYLELGTRKMGAKPGIKNAIDKNLQNGINIISNEINKGMK